jgi:hypothetical protein
MDIQEATPSRAGMRARKRPADNNSRSAKQKQKRATTPELEHVRVDDQEEVFEEVSTPNMDLDKIEDEPYDEGSEEDEENWEEVTIPGMDRVLCMAADASFT